MNNLNHESASNITAVIGASLGLASVFRLLALSKSLEQVQTHPEIVVSSGFLGLVSLGCIVLAGYLRQGK